MGFWNSVKSAVGIQSEQPQQPPMMVNVPMSALSQEQQQMFGGSAMPAQPMMRRKKPPMMITRIWNALNTPMVGRHAPQNRGNLNHPMYKRGPQVVTYPLPPVNRDRERKGIW